MPKRRSAKSARKKSAKSPARKRAKAPVAAPKQFPKAAASQLVVQFKHPEDPSNEQTEIVKNVVKKYSSKARVVREIPGALKINIRPETEPDFRRDIDALPDWDVASEGSAHMPPNPLPEESDDDNKKS